MIRYIKIKLAIHWSTLLNATVNFPLIFMAFMLKEVDSIGQLQLYSMLHSTFNNVDQLTFSLVHL